MGSYSQVVERYILETEVGALYHLVHFKNM